MPRKQGSWYTRSFGAYHVAKKEIGLWRDAVTVKGCDAFGKGLGRAQEGHEYGRPWSRNRSRFACLCGASGVGAWLRITTRRERTRSRRKEGDGYNCGQDYENANEDKRIKARYEALWHVSGFH